jgi:sec-independent protein translocase protein TatA
MLSVPTKKGVDMSLGNLGAHWWVILIIVVLLFGAPKLPALARSLGQSMKIFRSEIKNNDDEPGTTTGTGKTGSASADDTATKP